jgi:hypothetical protein
VGDDEKPDTPEFEKLPDESGTASDDAKVEEPFTEDHALELA